MYAHTYRQWPNYQLRTIFAAKSTNQETVRQEEHTLANTNGSSYCHISRASPQMLPLLWSSIRTCKCVQHFLLTKHRRKHTCNKILCWQELTFIGLFLTMTSQCSIIYWMDHYWWGNLWPLKSLPTDTHEANQIKRKQEQTMGTHTHLQGCPHPLSFVTPFVIHNHESACYYGSVTNSVTSFLNSDQ